MAEAPYPPYAANAFPLFFSGVERITLLGTAVGVLALLAAIVNNIDVTRAADYARSVLDGTRTRNTAGRRYARLNAAS